MIVNVGTTDRIIRVVSGLAILSLLFILEGNARWWGLIGLIPIASAVFSFCPAYQFLGINSCGTRARSGSHPKCN